MNCLHTFFLGVFVAGILGGLWWLIVGSGLCALLVRRSYFVLSAGIVLDLWFAYSTGFTGFYTVVFVLTTILVEYFRDKLFWTS